MMSLTPLTLHSYPRAILHIDGDAFFASCEQARTPALKGKPVVTGKERGIAASMSYEAKARGVTRGMPLGAIRRVCPEVIILPSDYETYSLLSKRFFAIVRRITPAVEEYSVDECFADLTGLRRPLRMSYEAMCLQIQSDLFRELGVSFSLGLAPSKVLAKVGSKWKKPSGFTAIPGRRAHEYLSALPLEKVWGIGSQTTAYLEKFGLYTALDFARKEEAWVKAHLTKPHYEIWQELRGQSVMPVVIQEKETYQSISKVKTFRPSSSDRAFVFSQLSRNVENACIKARRYNLAAKQISFFLRTHDFRHSGAEIVLSRASAFPNEIVGAISAPFDELYWEGARYRATGVVLSHLEDASIKQHDLFGATLRVEKIARLFESVDVLDKKYGKHTVHLASSAAAEHYRTHLPDQSYREEHFFRGETARRHIAIPLLAGEVR